MTSQHAAAGKSPACTTIELCVGAGCTEAARADGAQDSVIPGLRLCPECARRLSAHLQSIPRLYEECARVLSGSGQCRERTSGGGMPGLPFNATAADVRSAMLGILVSWSALVVEERRVTAPRRDIRSLAAFLSTHADWLAAHAAASEVSQEMAAVVRWARKVAFSEFPRQVRVGKCTEAGCPGDLVAMLRPQSRASSARIVCGADPGHAWTGDQWLQLNRRMYRAPTSAAADERWLSVADICALRDIAPGSVYRLASERRWRRRRLSGRTYYAATDIGDPAPGRAPGRPGAGMPGHRRLREADRTQGKGHP